MQERQTRRDVSPGQLILAVLLIFVGLIFLCAVCCCSSLSLFSFQGDWDMWEDFGHEMGDFGHEMGRMGDEIGRGFGEFGREMGRVFGGLGGGLGALIGCICGLWPLALIVVGVLLLINARRRPARPEPPAPPSDAEQI